MNNHFYSKLKWDTDFFGINISRLIVPPNLVRGELQSMLDAADDDLVYVFLHEDAASCDSSRKILEDNGALCMGQRITYAKDIAIKQSVDMMPIADKVSQKMIELAWVSGVCSRFRRDVYLRPHFEEMYKVWIEKEYRNGAVFVYPDADNAIGMASISVSDGVGIIGLVAVDEASRGRGIATRLLMSIDKWLVSNKISKCEVVTQGANVDAQRLYKRCAFAQVSSMEVWHLWKGNHK